MKRLVSMCLFMAFAVTGAGVTHAQEEKTSLVAVGRDYALKICRNCHLVTKDQDQPPILKPPAPSFSEIAARPDFTEEQLRAFLSKPHGESRSNSTMPVFLLAKAQIDQIVAYLQSLKTDQERPHN